MDLAAPQTLAAFDRGLPAGTAARAVGYAQSLADAVASTTGRVTAVDAEAALWHVHLPALLGSVRDAGAAVVPLVDGAVHADVTDDDRELFEVLRASMPDADAETLSSACQECRLPVTPYHVRRDAETPHAIGDAARPVRHGQVRPDELPPRGSGVPVELDLRRLRVLDLTSMWAGPLCTWLLASLGCEVVTIESHCRPDGLRGSPSHFAALASGKRRVDLDLRCAEDRLRFEDLVRSADLVVESFSARVMPNFGYAPEELQAIRPGLTTLSIRAFDADPARRHWVAYGPGVHAASGHGVEGGAARPAAHAYADALTGIAAAAAALRAMSDLEPPAAVVVGMDRVIAGLGSVSAPFEPAALQALFPERPAPRLPVRFVEAAHG